MKLTLVPLISGLALRTGLISIFSLVLVTSTANGEGTLIASNKNTTIDCKANGISTYLTYLAIQLLGLGLRRPQKQTN